MRRADRRKALELAIKQIEGTFGKGAIMRLGDECVPERVGKQAAVHSHAVLLQLVR